jgi:hypothetical protein
MRLFLVIILGFLLVGCAQLLNGQLQPVKIKDPNKGTYVTNCGGAVENWASCNDKAMNTCPKGYVVLEKTEDSNGIKRELIFGCKK